MTQPMSTLPRATARLQLHAGFTLDDAAAVAPYYARLGVSHLYLSPILTARHGSTHGYDTISHHEVSAELGGEDALRRLNATLRAHGMGLLLDIVPNHMGVGGAGNAAWLDVLAHGPSSRYAHFFDIDWESDDAALRGKILAPLLGRPYGEALAAGEITLQPTGPTGLAALYYDDLLPIRPEDAQRILAAPTGHTAAYYEDLTPTPSGHNQHAAQGLAAFNPSTAEGRARLHALLERQHYRLSHWKLAAEEINWRRFFDVTSLAGIRVEAPWVFEETHAVILRLYAEGLIDGLRIDHVDGLAQPGAYTRKLRRRMEALSNHRPPEAAQGAPYILVEKILASGEPIPADWRVDGTTGYDAMDQISAVLHDPAGAAPLSLLWRTISTSHRDFPAEERLARRQILRDNLGAEREACAVALHRIARADPMTRDIPLAHIRRVLTEILVHFPVYRTYNRAGRPSSRDATILLRAIGAARANLPETDHAVLDQLHLWLAEERILNLPAPLRALRLAARTRFQQLSSPTAAKSVEDTAFYRYGRLISRNEVGSDPHHLSLSTGAFHATCAERLRHFPGALLATATHDHKRGEDVRMRLATLSEIPGEWTETLQDWLEQSEPLREPQPHGPAPDPADAAMLFQMLVASWPLGLQANDRAGLAAWIARLEEWQRKALRESKRRSNWSAPDESYEAASAHFLKAVLDEDRNPELLHGIAGFAARLAAPGAVRSLAQTVLRLTTPGVPDLYQGTEYWDESLVDPDNRRPVNITAREASLRGQPFPAALLGAWQNGAVKQAVIHRLLQLRMAQPDLFQRGEYVPLSASGPHAGSIVAFLRRLGSQALLVALPRSYTAALLTDPVFPPGHWAETALTLPPTLAPAWADVMSGRAITTGARLPLEDLLADFPLLVLHQG